MWALIRQFLPELIITIGLALGHPWVWCLLVVGIVVFVIFKLQG
jgi:hypothetical protein